MRRNSVPNTILPLHNGNGPSPLSSSSTSPFKLPRNHNDTFKLASTIFIFILLLLLVNAYFTVTSLKEEIKQLEISDGKLKKLVEVEKNFHTLYKTCAVDLEKEKAPKYKLPSPYYPPEFERMYPDMFGPRPKPLVPKHKVLFVMPVGTGGQGNIDTIIRQLGTTKFTYILLHYDDTDWSQYSWNHDVIHITMHRQMKWWYLKRFITPLVTDFYEYIYVMDEDCILPDTWDNENFLDIARRNDLDIFQPSHNNSLHKIIKTRPGKVGRFTNFVEVGPFTIMSARGYECVWNMLLPDAVGGWGYDLFFENYCNLTMAIIDEMPIYHADAKTASSGRHDGAENEQAAVLARYSHVPHTWFGEMVNKGDLI